MPKFHQGWLEFNVPFQHKYGYIREDKFHRNQSKRCRGTAIFRFFQDSGRPPSWICDACAEIIHEGHLVVFITVQEMESDAVVLIIYMFFDFASLA